MHVHVAGGWGVFRIEGYSDLGSWNIHACTCRCLQDRGII